jgi:hypothetical protein
VLEVLADAVSWTVEPKPEDPLHSHRP